VLSTLRRQRQRLSRALRGRTYKVRPSQAEAKLKSTGAGVSISPFFLRPVIEGGDGEEYDSPEPSLFDGVSARNHKETCTGYTVSLATPTRSSLKASRSVSSLSLAEKASSVFLASHYFL
jgi:hypothetical protein